MQIPRYARDDNSSKYLHVHQLVQFCQSRQPDELALHQFEHDGFLRMQPVLCLLKYQRPRRVDDLVGDFIAAMRGQAMQEDRVMLRPPEQTGVNLIWKKDVPALL